MPRSKSAGEFDYDCYNCIVCEIPRDRESGKNRVKGGGGAWTGERKGGRDCVLVLTILNVTCTFNSFT